MRKLWFWHANHDVLAGEFYEGFYCARRGEIECIKPKREHELRFRLFKPIQGPIPQCVLDAWAEFNESMTAQWVAQRRFLDSKWWVWSVYLCWRASRADKIRTQKGKHYEAQLNGPEMAELHRKECPDCPWNGRTIFVEDCP